MNTTTKLLSLACCALLVGCGGEALLEEEFAGDEVGEVDEALVTVSSVEAEAMAFSPTTAGGVFAAPDASGGKGLLLWANATASRTVSLPAAYDTIVIRAKGDQCSGAPRMVVKLAGVQIYSAAVTATVWTNHTIKLAAPASGSKSLAISFTNDYRGGGCDRNLRLDRVYFNSSTSMPLVMGAYTGSAPTLESIDAFTALAGKAPRIVMWYEGWGYTVPRTRLDDVKAKGGVSSITWEPHNVPLKDIASGAHDAYITRQATMMAGFGSTVFLRFAHEMNGDWYSWGLGVNGNTAADYVAAYRRVVDLFRAAGATNVKYVWCPNVDLHLTQLAALYPGDTYVDYVALDGYNWGGTAWKTFTQVFKPTYDAVKAFTTKPMMIGEMASPEEGGSKAAWIKSAYLTEIPTAFPRIKAVIWFNANKERDWRVNSSTTAQDAYRAVAANARYQGTF